MAGNDIMNSAKFRKYMEKRFGFPQVTTTPGPAPITPRYHAGEPYVWRAGGVCIRIGLLLFLIIPLTD